VKEPAKAGKETISVAAEKSFNMFFMTSLVNALLIEAPV
jgi:hypothetical protein